MKRIVISLLILLLVFISGCTNQVTGAFLETMNCFPSWYCNEWSSCELVEEKWSQTRSCSDTNNCGDETGKPTVIESCEPPYEMEINIGETFSQCGVAITLESVEIENNITHIGSENEEKELIGLDWLFVIPKIKIENNFRHAVEVSNRDFQLEDQEKNIYETRCPNETVADLNTCLQGNSWHLGVDYIENGETKEGNIIFAIPKQDYELKLFYYFPLNTYDCNRVDRLYWAIK